MIDVNKLPEFPGFTVYDATSGINMDEMIYATDNDELYEDFIAMECGKDIPKEGKYIIQMGTGDYYRW